MDFFIVLTPSGNISLRTSVTVAYHKLLMTPAVLLVKKVIAICYVDDLIFWARNEKDIFELAIKLHSKGADQEQKVDAAKFLGLHIK